MGAYSSYSTALSANGFDPVALTASWAPSEVTTMQRIVIGRDARFLLYRMTETAMATRAGSASLQSSIHNLVWGQAFERTSYD